MSAGVIRFTTSAAAYPSMRSAPTLNNWMTPFSSVAMIEKLALLRTAFCRAPDDVGLSTLHPVADIRLKHRHYKFFWHGSSKDYLGVLTVTGIVVNAPPVNL